MGNFVKIQPIQPNYKSVQAVQLRSIFLFYTKNWGPGTKEERFLVIANTSPYSSYQDNSEYMNYVIITFTFLHFGND